ncbi:hypothetical protein [Sphaerisporangium fuscum]|uniref:hypothetical protein n=1 Tax=Sphaerisporangium fuscum TaxID=2835868 RepID=UPI001BDBD227|nr:hypothetical protein [Sphaerisporangium fuscum]
MITARYTMNEFRGVLRLRNEAPLQYFNGFYDPDHRADPVLELPPIEVEPENTPDSAAWVINVEGRPVSVAERSGGYTVWSAAGRYHAETAARRLQRDMWLRARIRRGGVAFLHASAVDDGHHLVVFVGDKRAGKTSLMLDATLRNGWRLVSNDCLVLFEGQDGLRACGLPTYLAIRPDVARRFEPELLARLTEDEANWRSYERWRTAPPVDDEGKLYLSHGVIGRPVFSTIELSTREVTVVDVSFGGATELARQAETEIPAFLAKNLKPMAYLLKELRWRPAGPLPVDEDILARFGASVRLLRYRHHGQAGDVLSYVATVRRP